MNESGRLERVALFAERCREQGLPLTPQRRAVLEAVLELDTHPTADQVHEQIVTRMPEVSRATVYRTLETLVAMGLITKVAHPGRAVRFDPRVEKHHHLLCLACDAVIDLGDQHFQTINLPDTSNVGFVVEDYSIQLRGICRTCREKEERR